MVELPQPEGWEWTTNEEGKGEKVMWSNLLEVSKVSKELLRCGCTKVVECDILGQASQDEEEHTTSKMDSTKPEVPYLFNTTHARSANMICHNNALHCLPHISTIQRS